MRHLKFLQPFIVKLSLTGHSGTWTFSHETGKMGRKYLWLTRSWMKAVLESKEKYSSGEPPYSKLKTGVNTHYISHSLLHIYNSYSR